MPDSSKIPSRSTASGSFPQKVGKESAKQASAQKARGLSTSTPISHKERGAAFQSVSPGSELKPSLLSPKAQPAHQWSVNVNKAVDKLNTPLPLEQMEKIAEQKEKSLKDKVAEVFKEIEEIRANKNMSPEYKLVQIMKAFQSTMNISLDVNAKFLQDVVDREFEAADKYQQFIKERREYREKQDSASIVTKVFSYFASVSTIAIGLGIIATGVATSALTGGTTGVLLGIAGACIVSAGIVGLSVQIMNDTGGMKKLQDSTLLPMFKSMGVDNPELATQITTMVAVTVVQVALALAATGFTLGAGAGATGTTTALLAFKTMTKIIALANAVNSTVSTLGQTGGNVAQGVFRYQEAEVESETVGVEKKQAFLAYINEDTKNIMDAFQEAIGKMLKMASSRIRDDVASTSQILGNM